MLDREMEETSDCLLKHQDGREGDLRSERSPLPWKPTKSERERNAPQEEPKRREERIRTIAQHLQKLLQPPRCRTPDGLILKQAGRNMGRRYTAT